MRLGRELKLALMASLLVGTIAVGASPAAASQASKHTKTSPTAGLPKLPSAMTKPLTSPHLAPGSNPSVLPGPILIADRSNNRLIVVNPKGQIVWQFPRPGDLAPGQTFLIPDDAFFTPDGKYIIATEEDNFVISVISIAQHKIIYRYGTPGQEGMGPNQLWNPDDAMMLPDGYILSPDIKNCRILLLKPGDMSPVHIFGMSTNACLHDPPYRFGSPNGAFPMTNGHYAVTEINGDWVNEMGINGTIYQSFHAPGILYPSDTNEVRPGVFLTADYSKPGTVEEFTSSGQVLWRYSPSGAQALNQPSLALPLPNGDVVLNDDKNNRVIVVDPKTDKVVWQYGTGIAGSAPGQLSNPDGIDLAPPYSLLVTHAATMGIPAKGASISSLASSVTPQPMAKAPRPLRLVSRQALPVALQRDSVVATKTGLSVVGGLDNSGNSTARTFQLSMSGSKVKVSSGRTLSQPTHDAAASFLRGKVFVFGGGMSATTATVQSISPHGTSVVGNLPQPRSDLAAAQTPQRAYVVGGYNGLTMDSNVLSTSNGTSFSTIGTLPQPVRYASAVVYGGHLYVFGGEIAGQPVSSIQAVNLKTGQAEIVGQLPTALGAPSAVVVNGSIYVMGGSSANGTPQSAIYQFDPKTALITYAGRLPRPLSNAGVARWGNEAVVVGGATTGSGLSNGIYVFAQGSSRHK